MVVVAKHRVERYPNDPAYMLLPVIWVNSNQILEGHLRYLIWSQEGRTLSKTWLDKSARSVALLLKFAIAHQNEFKSPQELFGAFVETLTTGTIIDRDNEDPYELNWEPRSNNNVSNIINHITQFNDYIYESAKQRNKQNPEQLLLNPPRSATFPERMINLAAYHHKKNNAFLAHLYDDQEAYEKAKKVRTFLRRQNPATQTEEVKAFPEDLIFPLLEAFTLPGSRDGDPIHKRYNLRNVLITMLLHYGGLRLSEPFHLYIDDIIKAPDSKKSLFSQEVDIKPNDQSTLTTLSKDDIAYLDDLPQALVTLYHPSEGDAPERGYSNRKEYLAKKYNLLPRNDKRNPKCYYSGWKNLAVNKEGKYAQVHFFPLGMEAIFWNYWTIYLEHQYDAKGKHPFAFVNKNGDPASYHQFIKAHERALQKLGTEVSKRLGTTRHGHRHATGTRSEEYGISSIVTQRLLRHKSIESQNVYKTRSNKEIRRTLSEGVSRLRKKPE